MDRRHGELGPFLLFGHSPEERHTLDRGVPFGPEDMQRRLGNGGADPRPGLQHHPQALANVVPAEKGDPLLALGAVTVGCDVDPVGDDPVVEHTVDRRTGDRADRGEDGDIAKHPPQRSPGEAVAGSYPPRRVGVERGDQGHPIDAQGSG